MATWTEETEEQLITLVEERPPLYNITLQCYSNRNKKDQLWREIESELRLSAKDIRRKWDNLRTTYNRYKKPAPSGSSGAPRTARQQWILSRLHFIEPHTKRKESTSNLTHQELFDAALPSTPESPEGVGMLTGTSLEPELDSSLACSPVAESTICESMFTDVLRSTSSASSTSQSQCPPAKRRKKGQGVPAAEDGLMQQIRETLGKIVETQGEDHISVCCKRIENRMRMLLPHRLIQFEFDVDSLLYKHSQMNTD